MPWALPLPLAAWPLAAGATGLLAMTASSSRGAASAADPCAADAEALSGALPEDGWGLRGGWRSYRLGVPGDFPLGVVDGDGCGGGRLGRLTGRIALMADRSIRPSVAFSSVVRNREPSHRKM